MIFSSPRPRDPIARKHLQRQQRPDSPLQSTRQCTLMSVAAHRQFVKHTARASEHVRNREEARSYPPRKPEPWGASTSASPLPPVCWLHEPLPLPLHGKTETWEISDRRNQSNCGASGRASAGADARVPGEEEGSESAAACAGRRGRERLTATGRAAMAMESMVERPSGEATANDDECGGVRSRRRLEEVVVTLTRTRRYSWAQCWWAWVGSGPNMTDHVRGQRPKCVRSPDGAGKKNSQNFQRHLTWIYDMDLYISIHYIEVYKFKRIIALSDIRWHYTWTDVINSRYVPMLLPKNFR